MKRLLTLFVCCCISLSIFAQNSFWEEAKGPYGGGFFDITKTSTGRLYANASPEQLYRSDDNGLTWERLPPIGGQFTDSLSKTIKFGNAGSLFLGQNSGNGYNRWYKSTDEGQSWVALDITITSINETDNGTLIGIKNLNSTWRSMDGGLTWSLALNVSGTLGITPFGEIVVRTYTQIHRSQDDGATWSVQNIDPSGPFNYLFFSPSGVVLGFKNDTLYRSVNGGQTFTSTMVGGIPKPTYTVLNSGRILIQIAPYSSSYLAYDLIYSDDDGLSWQTLATTQQGAGGELIQIAPLNDGTIFKDYLDVLLRSSDGGQTWQFSGTGIRSATVEDMQFVTDSLYFALNRIGLWKTENAGETWKLLTQNSLISRFNQRNFAITPTGGVAVFRDNSLLWSSDYGETFSDITPAEGLPTSFRYVFINPADNTLFVNYFTSNFNYGIKKSTNFGQTWTISSDENFVHGMAFHPSGRIIANCIIDVLISDNGGITWSSVPNPEGWSDSGPIAVVAPNGAIFLSRENRTLWRSLDVGNTWTKMDPVLEEGVYGFESMAISGNGHLYVSDGYEVLSISLDGGDNWQSAPGQFPLQYVHNIALSPSQKLFAGVWGIVPQLYQSRKSIFDGAYIEGYVRVDADADCSTQDAQAPLANRIVEASNTDLSYYTRTNAAGHYLMFVDTGSYEVTVQNPSGIWWSYCDSLQSVDLPEHFIRDTADFAAIPLSFCPLMTVDMAIPTLRRCFDNQVYVAYCNQGVEATDGAWVDIILDPYLTFVGSSQTHTILANDTIRFLVADLPTGACGDFQLAVHVNCDSTVLGQTHCVIAHGFPDTLCTTVPDWSGANIVASATCLDSVLQFKVSNTGIAPSQNLDFIIIEDDVALLTGQHSYNTGESVTFNYPANGSTWRIESNQEPGHPFSNLALAFAEGCGGFSSLGYINHFPVNGIQPAWHQVCVENIGSFDPNDKQGFPLGFGPQHSIRPGQRIDYLIRFQNTGTDTAFTVVVRDTLSPLLDPLSFRKGASSHDVTWELTAEGVLAFTFSNIALPDSNVNEATSHGFVQFSIAPKEDVSLGSVIENEAAIFFDFNAPVITNTTWHTIENSPLQVAVRPEPKQTSPELAIWPNPFTDLTFIHFEKKSAGVFSLKVFDGTGKLVALKATTGSVFEFQGGYLPAGLYWAEVYDAQGRLVGRGKMMRQ